MFNSIKYIKRIGILLISLFYITSAIGQSGTSGNKSIIIINSYNNNIKWATEVADTIKNHLAKYSPALKITMKSLNSNENNGYASESKVLEIINNTEAPSIAILIGSEAETIYNTRLKGIIGWENVKSISTDVGATATSRSNSGTGVGFGIPIKENIDLIKTMVPGVNEILWIDKNYSNARQTKSLLEKELLLPKNNKIKLNAIYLTKDNSNSIYNIILENKPKRAILTCSWDFFDKTSSYAKHEVDSIFTAKLTTPIFSIFPNYYNNSFIVGGYNLSARVCAEKVVEQTKKIIEGVNPANIPFEEVKNGDIILNKVALRKYALESYTKEFFDVKYVNSPISSFEKYKIEFIISLISLIFLIIALFYYYKKSMKSRINRKKLKELKNNLNLLKNIYNNSNFNYAIYGSNGDKIVEMMNDYNGENEQLIKDFLPNNLFNVSFISKEELGHIKSKRNISKEYSSTVLEKYSKVEPSEVKFVHFIVKSIQIHEDATYKYIVVVSDITNNKTDKLEKDALNNLIKDAIDITDIGIASYNILTGKGFATDNWYNNLGEQRTDNIIQPSYSNCSTEDKAKILDFKKNLINATASRLGMDIKVYNTVSGKERWIRQNIFLHEYDPKKEIIEVIDINFDINKEKVKELNFINLNKKAENSNNDSDKFINSISHEIRTPLTSIMGFSNMLTTLSNPDEKVEIINIIKRNNVMLIELVNNILSISKIDSDTYQFESTKVELNEFFHELKIAAAHMIATESVLTNKNVEIICDIPKDDHSIVTDEWNFRQIMINLLSNAVKFTNEGTIIFGYQPHEEGIYFYVKDTGCGIALENQDKIFNKFEKFNIQSHGTGLGLSLCKSIVNRLNGDIGVISKEGEGSTFWFILKND